MGDQPDGPDPRRPTAHPPPAAALVGATSPGALPADRAGRHQAAPGPRTHHRRPARRRPSAYSKGGVRLHRRRSRARAQPCSRPLGVPPAAVQPERPARRLHRRPEHDAAGPPIGIPVRVRSHRLHPDDATRGRTRRCPRGRTRRHSVRPVHAQHHLDRGRRRGGTGRRQVVPALHLARPCWDAGPHRPRESGRIPDVGAHRRRTGRGCPAA